MSLAEHPDDLLSTRELREQRRDESERDVSPAGTNKLEQLYPAELALCVALGEVLQDVREANTERSED